MKRLIAIAFFLTLISPVFPQSWDRVYKMPTRQSKFLDPIGTGSVVVQQDTFRIIELTGAVRVGWKLDTVYKLGLWKAHKGSEWSVLSGVLSPASSTDRVVIKNGFHHYAGDGDVNGSGGISNPDIILISNYIQGKSTLTDLQKARADVDNDGKITFGDMIYMRLKIMGLYSSFDTARGFLGKCLFQTAPGVPQLSSKKLIIPYTAIASESWAFDVEAGGSMRIPKNDTMFFGGSTSSKHADTVVGIYKKSNGILGIFGKLGLDGYTLPAAGGTPGQVLKFPASGTLLEWGAAGSDPMTTRGDIIYHNGTAPARLAAGTLNQVLTMYNNDGHLEPHWADPSGGHTADSIWHRFTSVAYASSSTFSFIGTADQARRILFSLVKAVKSDGTVLRVGYVKSAVESGGTVTATYIGSSDLASGDVISVAVNQKIQAYQRFITSPGECAADTGQVGMYYLNNTDTLFLLPVDFAVRKAAAGAGAALTVDIRANYSGLFSSDPSFGTNKTVVEQRPTTWAIAPAKEIDMVIVTSAGGTNKASSIQARLILVPSQLFR